MDARSPKHDADGQRHAFRATVTATALTFGVVLVLWALVLPAALGSTSDVAASNWLIRGSTPGGAFEAAQKQAQEEARAKEQGDVAARERAAAGMETLRMKLDDGLTEMNSADQQTP